jgi:hypothetical protein
MANTKISELPLFTGNTAGAYLVMNNSGQTTTFKVTRENIIGASGTSGTSGTSGSSGAAGSSGTSGDGIFAQTGSVWNTTNNIGITGSLAVSGSITSTSDSTFNGVVVGRAAGSTNTTNTRVGNNSLLFTGVGATGTGNTAVGRSNLTNVSVGLGNTAIGAINLAANISGSYNTSIGVSNLVGLRTGNENTAIGWGNLNAMVTGSSTIAIGTSNLVNYLGDGFNNMAIGPRFTLNQLQSGAENIAIGSYAMQNVRTGSNNTIIGGGAFANMTGSNNIGLGFYAGTNLTGTVNNTLVIDSLLRTFYPNEGLIYGTMNSTVANQTLKFNAATTITNNTTITGSLTVSGNTTITGSLTVSGAVPVDVDVVGNFRARNTSATKVINLNTDNGLIQLNSSSFATSILGTGNLELSKNADKIEITAEATTGSKCQFRTTEPTGSQVTIIELPCSSDWNNGTTKFKYPVEITGSLKVTEALNTRPLYYGTGSIYGNNFQNVPGTPGDIRIFYDDNGSYNLAFFTVSGSNSWFSLP